MVTDLIMPLIYHFRGKSDRPWIAQRMKVIPEVMRKEVAGQYENLFIRNVDKNGRRDANEYLDSVAKQYRDNLDEPKVKLINPRHIARKIEPKIDSNKKPSKSNCGLWSKEL